MEWFSPLTRKRIGSSVMRPHVRVLASALLVAAGHAWAAPSGTSTTLNTTEDTPLTLTPANFGFSDPDGYAFAQVAFVSQAATGVILLNGVPVISSPPAPPIPVSEFAANHVTWVPALNSAGAGVSSVLFQVINSNGEPDPTPRMLTLNVSAVNDAPDIGTDLIMNGAFGNGLAYWAVTGNIRFAYGGLAFNTGNDTPNGVASQVIATQPGATYTVNLKTSFAGYLTPTQQLRVDAIDVATNTVLATANYGQAVTGTLAFTAAGGSTRIQITDISTTTVNTDIALTQMSAYRADSDNSTYEDQPLVWSNANGRPIRVSDVDGTAGTYTLTLSVTHGTLSLSSVAGLSFSAGGNNAAFMTINGTQASINAALDGLAYLPAANYNGADTLSLLLNDNGNTGAGPALTASKALALNVLPVNDAPSGADKTVTLNEGTVYTFTAADFGFSDPFDNPANALQAVKVSSLPGAGVLSVGGLPVAAGQMIAVSDLSSLSWTSPPNLSGVALASFTFQVQDDGGTANGGVDLDPTPKTFVFNVNAVNHPPVAVDDAFNVTQGQSQVLDLVGNDTDIDGDTLQVASIHGVTLTPGVAQTFAVPHGTVSVNASGIISFTADSSYVGSTSFDYVVSDGHGGQATATVTITVTAAVPVGGIGFLAVLTTLLAGLGWGALRPLRRR